MNPEQGFFTHEVYSDSIFFKLAEAAVDILGKLEPCHLLFVYLHVFVQTHEIVIYFQVPQ